MLGFQVSLWDVRLYFFCWNIRHPTAVCIFFSSGQDFFPFFSSHRHPFPGIFSANRLCYGRRSALNLLTTPFVPRFPNSPLAKSFMGLFRFLYKVKCLSRADWRSLLGELWSSWLGTGSERFGTSCPQWTAESLQKAYLCSRAAARQLCKGCRVGVQFWVETVHFIGYASAW